MYSMKEDISVGNTEFLNTF